MKKGQEVLFPTYADLANILGDTDLGLIYFFIWGFQFFRFPRFPGSQISRPGLGQASAGSSLGRAGPGLQAWAGPVGRARPARWAWPGLWAVHKGQEGLENDPEPYGFVLSQYEPIWNHMDPFQNKLYDFHQNMDWEYGSWAWTWWLGGQVLVLSQSRGCVWAGR